VVAGPAVVAVSQLVPATQTPSQHSGASAGQQPPLQIRSGGQQTSLPMHTVAAGQHSPPQHCSGVSQQSSPQTTPPAGQQRPPSVQSPAQHPSRVHSSSPDGHGSGEGLVVVPGSGLGGGGGGMVGRLPVLRASATGWSAEPATAAPPSPNSALRTARREAPLPMALARLSNRRSSIRLFSRHTRYCANWHRGPVHRRPILQPVARRPAIRAPHLFIVTRPRNA
jgi:hypothetical protein